MINSAAKISLDKSDQGDVVIIYPQLSTWQTVALRVWLVIWVLCGLLAIMGMLAESEGSQFVYMLVFIALWGYFFYYAGRSMLWHQNGKEYLRFAEDSLDYKRGWGTFGKVVSYDWENMKEVGMVNLDDKAFARTYQDAFWTVGGEKIGFEYLGRKVVIGLRLNDKDAKTILKMMAKKTVR